MADDSPSSGRAAAPAGSIPMAVIGDSNSHSYRDSISFPPGSRERGGALRGRNLQWVEIVARMRGGQLDPGPWVAWGRSGNVAWLRESIGLSAGRAPRKEDYLYNFANSGAACKHLMGDRLGQRFRQVPRLVALMDKDRPRWRNGVVVIRMGHNDCVAMLDVQARDPASPELKATTDYCVSQIEAAIGLIHSRHPATRIMVVGVHSELDYPRWFSLYRSARETTNVQTANVAFNCALRKLTSSDPRIAWFDDSSWIAERWGTRSAEGEPVYKTVNIGTVLRVTNTAGDDLANAQMADDHAGLAWNAMWAQSIVARLKDAFDLPLTPISDEELERFIASQVDQISAP
ncbi:SGNH/GDSL hydrolase family protein [Variovorax humicola]|uniref:SGNH/GDSL hydrolase family protein n=1 Tax=Variovorax humicola TaxID=1769758 RepID=A0ABU8W071_9BURK